MIKPAESVAASRKAQGLPPKIVDASALAKVVRLLMGGRS